MLRMWKLSILIFLLAFPANGWGKTIEYTYQDSYLAVSEPVDFALHLYSHLFIGANPASLYNPQYIAAMNELKREKATGSLQLERELADFAAALRRSPALHNLPVLASYTASTRSYLAVLKFIATSEPEVLSHLSPEEAYIARHFSEQFSPADKQAIGEFYQVATQEYDAFYASYWQAREEFFAEQLEMFLELNWKAGGYEQVHPFFVQHGVTELRVYFSEAMQQNGRGFTYPFSDKPNAAAITRLPVRREEIFYSYTIALHEWLHQITDPVVAEVLEVDLSQRSLDQSESGYQLHNLLENSVVLTQYWLMEQANPSFKDWYLQIFSTYSSQRISSYAGLLASFPVPPELERALQKLIK